MSDLSVTHNIRHIDEKRYSFSFHFIVYPKYNFWRQLCKTSLCIQTFLGRFVWYFSLHLQVVKKGFPYMRYDLQGGLWHIIRWNFLFISDASAEITATKAKSTRPSRPLYAFMITARVARVPTLTVQGARHLGLHPRRQGRHNDPFWHFFHYSCQTRIFSQML